MSPQCFANGCPDSPVANIACDLVQSLRSIIILYDWWCTNSKGASKSKPPTETVVPSPPIGALDRLKMPEITGCEPNTWRGVTVCTLPQVQSATLSPKALRRSATAAVSD